MGFLDTDGINMRGADSERSNPPAEAPAPEAFGGGQEGSTRRLIEGLGVDPDASFYDGLRQTREAIVGVASDWSEGEIVELNNDLPEIGE